MNTTHTLVLVGLAVAGYLAYRSGVFSMRALDGRAYAGGSPGFYDRQGIRAQPEPYRNIMGSYDMPVLLPVGEVA